MVTKEYRVIGIRTRHDFRSGDDIVGHLLTGLSSEGVHLQDGDVVVITHKVVSKVEGRVVTAESVVVSERARRIAERNGFDPVQVELALREAVDVLREERALITETRGGLICSFSGVDRSNAPGGTYVLLPEDPDASAQRFRDEIVMRTGRHVGVVVSDTQGRPWRDGAVNVALGCAGVNAFTHNRGKSDLYGYVLRSSKVCTADELAAAAELLMGQAGEGVPFVIVRGLDVECGEEHGADINRPRGLNLFR